MASVGTKFSLLFRAGSADCALPIEHVVETMRPLPLYEIPGLPPAAGGSAMVRGTPLTVLTLSRWLAREHTPPTRMVIARAGKCRLGLAVDGVIGVRALAADMFARLTPLTDEAPPDVTGALESELLAVLQATRIVPPGIVAALEIEAAAS